MPLSRLNNDKQIIETEKLNNPKDPEIIYKKEPLHNNIIRKLTPPIIIFGTLLLPHLIVYMIYTNTNLLTTDIAQTMGIIYLFMSPIALMITVVRITNPERTYYIIDKDKIICFSRKYRGIISTQTNEKLKEIKINNIENVDYKESSTQINSQEKSITIPHIDNQSLKEINSTLQNV